MNSCSFLISQTQPSTRKIDNLVSPELVTNVQSSIIQWQCFSPRELRLMLCIVVICPYLIFLVCIESMSVEFSIGKIMCRKISGTSIGSPLGWTMANILVYFYEQDLFSRIKMFLLIVISDIPNHFLCV